eukprot:352664-Chlamydomonas_euryale.AAC.4
MLLAPGREVRMGAGRGCAGARTARAARSAARGWRRMRQQCGRRSCASARATCRQGGQWEPVRDGLVEGAKRQRLTAASDSTDWR